MKNLMTMKSLMLVGFAMVTLIACEDNTEIEVPSCMEEKIETILEEDVWNPPAKLYSYSYKGETVYFFPQRCCDIYSELYDSECNLICAPDGGITGSGDGQCTDFFSERTDEKLVWVDPRTTCDSQVIVDESKYANASEQYGSIINAGIIGDCLTIEFGASGCSGNSWVTELFDSEAVMESYPPQRNIKFSLINEEICQAYFKRTVTFDVNQLRVDGNSRVILNLVNYDGQLIYEY